jgi:hypothetical protein
MSKRKASRPLSRGVYVYQESYQGFWGDSRIGPDFLANLDWEQSEPRQEMFIFGALVILSWLFCFFYYGEIFPRNMMVGMLIVGLFSMGWGLLAGKR